MNIKEPLSEIASFTRQDVGPKEENVKQKIVVPLLELLGHKKNDLDFEHATTGGEIDIFIKGLPSDCKVVIDTKNYDEDLDNHIEQIGRYTYNEGALIAVIINGTEFRIYSLLRGIAFERSLLHSFKRSELLQSWDKFKNFLGKENLTNHEVIRHIETREKEIRGAFDREEQLKVAFSKQETSIKEEIEVLKGNLSEKEEALKNLEEEKSQSLSDIWQGLGLPPPSPPAEVAPKPIKPEKKEAFKKGRSRQIAGRVTLQELVEAGLLRNKEKLYFYHTKLFKDEAAEVIADSNRLKYLKDGKLYSVSTLAHILLRRHGFFKTKHSVAGPLYWMTADERLLNDLNEEIRRKRGDRK